MIVLGNKNIITPDEKTSLLSKFTTIYYVDISNDSDDNIIQNIKDELNSKDVEFLVLNLEKSLSIKLKAYLEELDYDGLKILTFSEFVKNFLDREFIEFNENNMATYTDIHHDETKQVLKRVFDFFFAIFALVFLSPFMIIIAFLIKLNSPEGPIFFTQQRLGLNGRFFRVFKFRTMIPNAEEKLNEMLNSDPKIKEEYLKYRKLQNDPRIIPKIGNILRKTSLDELPQFFNVLLGDMSVVGPRPYIKDEFYSHDEKFLDIILSVRPGVTGLWQVSNRNNTTFNDRVEQDVEYIANQSFLEDLKIIVKTIKVMIFKQGA